MIKNRNNRRLPDTYTRTKTMLWNMVADGLLEQPHRDHPQQAYLFSRKGVKAPANYYNRAHDQAVGDLFVAYQTAVPDLYWDVRWPEDDKVDYQIDKFRVHYDARMHLKDKVYLFEHDRSTEPMGDFQDKIGKYITFSNTFPQDRFTVLITVTGYRHIKALDRVRQIIQLLQKKRRGHQFLVSLHEKVLADPLGSVWLSPVDPMTAKPLSAFYVKQKDHLTPLPD